MKLFVTGGAGFIGVALIRHLLDQSDHEIINPDALTYVASPAALASVENNSRYHFYQVDICDQPAVKQLLPQHQSSC